MEKICKRCGILKDEKKFKKDKRQPDLRTVTCRHCYEFNHLPIELKYSKTDDEKERWLKKVVGKKRTLTTRLKQSVANKKRIEEGSNKMPY